VKALPAKLLLALSLAVNSVTVLASGLPGVEAFKNLSGEVISCAIGAVDASAARPSKGNGLGQRILTKLAF